MASSRESLDSGDGELIHTPENKEKKKRFQPFKKMRQLFSRKKNKYESSSSISKSTSELSKVQRSGTNEGLQVPLNSDLRSFSAESVLPQYSREGDLGRLNKDITRSMEHIHQKQFALHPAMSHSSEDSIAGMSSENENEDFYGGWTPSSRAEPATPDTVNLDAISSNTSLNVSAAKHRISVANKARRTSSKHKKTRPSRSKSPLARVEESNANNEPTNEPKGEPVSPTTTPPPLEVDDLKSVEKNESKEVRFSVKTIEAETKEDSVPIPVAGVVLRKKRESSEQDVAKRRTISESGPASDNLTSVLGERAKRASSYESRNWESVNDQEISKDDEKNQENVSEFTAAFNKVRRKSSKRKDVDVKEDSSQEAVTFGERKKSIDDANKSTSIMYTAAHTPAKVAPSTGTGHNQLDGRKSNENSSVSNKAAAFQKEETLNSAKPAILTPKPNFVLNLGSKDDGPDAYKKATPVQKPKWRSKTLPEQTSPSMDSLRAEKTEPAHSGKIKRTSSQHIEKVSPLSPSSENKSMASDKRSEMKKSESEETADETVPEWVRLVRARKNQDPNDTSESAPKKKKVPTATLR